MRGLKLFKILSSLTFLVFGFFAAAETDVQRTDSATFDAWVTEQSNQSLNFVFRNIEYSREKLSAHPGAIVASPGHETDGVSGEKQDYRFHWVRDGALVMHSLLGALQLEARANLAETTRSLMTEYINLVYLQQRSAGSNLGEPKFHLNGEVFKGEWGRPQNDGPALRALTLLKWLELNSEINSDQSAKIFREVIWPDIEYTADHYGEFSFDAWEEVLGDHFYIELIQMAALTKALPFAQKYLSKSEAKKISKRLISTEKIIEKFASRERGYILSNHQQTGGHVRDKVSRLDVAVLMAANFYDRFGVREERSWYSLKAAASPILNPWMMATAGEIRNAFEAEYAINKNGHVGVLVGRYPEDRYFGGNPWPVTTMAYAEYCYRLATALQQVGSIEVVRTNLEFVNAALAAVGQPALKAPQVIDRSSLIYKAAINGLIKSADDIFRRVRLHVGRNGELSEQFHRDIGFLTALPHLTWSYSAFIDAALARKRAIAPECAQLIHE